MKTLLFTLLFFGSLISCEKQKDEPVIDPNKGTVTFWTTVPIEWILYIDDVKIGSVWKPYPINTTDKIPVCGDKQFLSLSLLEGRHYYHMELTIPIQPPPNHFISQTYSFDIIAGECTVLRIIQ